MTNEEALKILDTIPTIGEQVDALEMAIKALETIPKYKDAYNKGWDDGAKASYEHLKMCEEEQGGDLISRQKAISLADELKDDLPDDDHLTDMVVAHNEGILEYQKQLSLLPPVKQEPSSSEKPNKWIPVSERLPELNKPLLVTAYHRVCYAHMISESGNYGYPIFRLHEIKDSDRGWVQETISHEPYSKGRIDAWMYIDIPEPYKVEPQERSEKE